MKQLLLAFVAILLGFTSIIAQDIERDWRLDYVENNVDNNLFSDKETLSLDTGEFEIKYLDDKLI